MLAHTSTLKSPTFDHYVTITPLHSNLYYQYYEIRGIEFKDGSVLRKMGNFCFLKLFLNRDSSNLQKRERQITIGSEAQCFLPNGMASRNTDRFCLSRAFLFITFSSPASYCGLASSVLHVR